MPLNPIQFKALEHLNAPSRSPERAQALLDLTERGLFVPGASERASVLVVEEYLEHNPRGFCDGGIERFKVAVLPKPKPKPVKVTVTLDLEIEGVTRPVNYNPGRGGSTADAIAKALLGVDCRLISNTATISKATVTSLAKEGGPTRSSRSWPDPWSDKYGY